MITYDTVMAMLDYPCRDRWLAGPMTRQQAAALSPADRRLRRMAKERLRHRKPPETFTYATVQ